MSTVRFIVTGGAGFIGSNLVKALNARGNNDILIVDDLNHPGKEQNLKALAYTRYMDKADFRRELAAGTITPPATVFHLGACSSTIETDEAYLADNNFLYTRNLCEWCIGRGVRFIYASSAATYGDGRLGYSDDHRLIPSLRPLNPYGRSKQAFDAWALENDLLGRIVGLKYFNVYGPGEAHKGAMRSVINKAYAEILRTGEMCLFRSHRPDYRDGEQDRDFVYARDAVAVTLFFDEHPAVSGIFNCGTGRARTWIDLANALFAAMNKTARIRFTDMPMDIRNNYQYHTQAGIMKLRAAGYGADFMSIEEGVSDYVRTFLSQQRA
jgi:ADP-L-glycero-D-manno-heptose 6-epimerase